MKNAVLNSLTHARLKNLFVALLTLGSSCLLPSAQGSVTVDQVPLTVQSPIAPNIVLMLDDSGSMGWNFMPDLCTGSTANLAGVTCASSGDINTQSNNDALTNALNNGVYYNPATTYTPPTKVDGTTYANSPGLTNAYANGFTNTATAVDITTYASTTTFSGSSAYNYTGAYDVDFNNNTSGKSNVALSTSTSAISATCPSGYSISNRGTYQAPDYECSIYGTQTPSCSAGTFNSTTNSCDVPPTPNCSTGYTLTGSGASTTCSGTATINPTCPSGTYGTVLPGLCTVAPTNCATTYGSGYALTNTGTSGSPNYQCQKTSTPTCSSGTYASATGTCSVTPPAPTCGSGYSLADIDPSGTSNFQCRKTATPTCSSGTYTASAGTCVVTPPTPTCTGGYTLTNMGTSSSPNFQCMKTVTPTCPTGTYGSSTGTCTVTPPTPTCSTSGTALSQPSGASAYNCNSTPTCASGTYANSSGTCTVTPPAPTCLSGTSLSVPTGAGGYTCNTTPTCASGTYTPSAGTCAITPPTPTCVNGTSLSVPTGASAYNCNSVPTCSSGTYTNSTGTCAVVAPTPTCSTGGTSLSEPTGATAYNCNSVPTCSSGTYSASAGTCVVTPPTPSCASTPGTSLSKPTGASAFNCNSTPTCSPSGTYNNSADSCTAGGTRTCPSGTTRGRFSGANIYTCNATASPTCSTGTYASSTGTCTVTPPTPTCPSGTSLSKFSGSSVFTCNAAAAPSCSTGTFASSTGSCTVTPPTPTCPGSTSLSQFSGAAVYTCNATPSCSTGTFTSASGTCTVTPPTASCLGGTSLGKFSGASVYTCNVNPTCSSGTFTSSSGTCTVVPPAPTCPSGTSLGKFSGSSIYTCNASASPSCSPGTFTASSGTCAVTPPAPTCSSGTLTNVGTSSSPNFQCQATATPTCSSGTYGSSTGTCTVVPPTPACGSGFSLANTGTTGSPNYQCQATATPTCSSGTYASSTGTCTIVAPAPACASGFSLTNIGTSASPNYQCQRNAAPACSTSGYSFNSGAGVCSFPPVSCPSGYTGAGTGTSLVCSKPVTATPSCTTGTYSSSAGICLGPTATCSTSTYSVTNTGTAAAPAYQCAGYTTTAAICSSGTFTSTVGQCAVTGTATKNFFQFTTGPAAGPYVNYYVASTAQGCVNIPHSSTNCVTENDTSGVAAPSGVKAGQNIANWFSYYHTRILTAKSGLMVAFDKLDPSSRLGFASINGNNNSGLPSSTYTSGSVKVATVSPFDNSCVTSTTSPCAKGQSGTQRAAFWSWVINESANNSTPLRSALNAIGQYYSQNAPWQSSSTDTTRLACRQAYTIATTDGFWNDPTPPSPGNVDNANGTQITGPNGQGYTYTAVAPFKDATSNTLADVAMKYWSTDLQTDVDNEVPTGSADPAFWQHMTTFTLGLGFTPTGITPAGTTMDQVFVWANGADSSTGTKTNGNIPTNFAWPVPASNSVYNIADLAHAAVNGHGGFYSATSPKSFSDGISDALNRVQSRTGTGASLAANSTKLGVGTVTYQALYYTVKWTGDLKAYNVDPTSGAISASPTWTASTVLPAAASRTIMTYNPSGSTSATKYVAFSDPAALSTAQKTALGSTAAIQQNVINYLRGDSSLEANKSGGTFRIRSTPLGDIINSQPVYVGTPNPNLFYGKTFTGSDSYPVFAANNISRTAVIWVAANDGMLHAFRTSDGVEIYAYIPGAVITNNLANLANVNYGGSAVPHQFFNDGEMTVADVYTTLPSGTTASWRTVLVGNTGHGPAKTIYALDITDPTAPIFLWERSAADGLTNSGYIGQVTGQPVIAQTANGTWSVLVGNGYNSTQNKAALLQFDLMSGTLTVHTTDNAADNGLAAPVVWIGTLANDISTVAYAGDLKGRVWSFTLFDTTLSTPAATPSSSGSVVFTTSDGGTKVQPITAGLLAGKDPNTGNLWLFFGTGQYMTQSDLSNRDVQSWYGIIVQSSDSTLPTQLASWTGSRTAGTTNALVPRSITAQQDATSTTLAARTITVPTNGDMLGKSGWFLDLVKPPSSTAQGERMVTPNQFQGSLLLGTSRVPIVSDPCNPSGSGWIMALNPFTGGNPTGLFFDLNGDQKFDASDQLNGIPAGGIGFGSVANNPIFVGNTMLTSFDNGTISSLDTAGTIGAVVRLSWRELVTH